MNLNCLSITFLLLIQSVKDEDLTLYQTIKSFSKPDFIHNMQYMFFAFTECHYLYSLHGKKEALIISFYYFGQQ